MRRSMQPIYRNLAVASIVSLFLAGANPSSAVASAAPALIHAAPAALGASQASMIGFHWDPAWKPAVAYGVHPGTVIRRQIQQACRGWNADSSPNPNTWPLHNYLWP
jgi:hypothetical protein